MYRSYIQNRVITVKSQSTILSLTYQYDKTGAVVSVAGWNNGSSNTENEAYKYDKVSRLTRASVKSKNTNSTITYQYDNVGNRMSQAVYNGATTRYSYNARNMLTNSTGLTCTYDSNGNMISRYGTGQPSWSYNDDIPGH